MYNQEITKKIQMRVIEGPWEQTNDIYKPSFANIENPNSAKLSKHKSKIKNKNNIEIRKTASVYKGE